MKSTTSVLSSSPLRTTTSATQPPPPPPLNLERLCGLLQQQRRLLSHAAALQPSPAGSGRSFSQPELRAVTGCAADELHQLDYYKAFREQLLKQASQRTANALRPCVCGSKLPENRNCLEAQPEEPPYSGKSSLLTADYEALQLPPGGSSLYGTTGDDTTTTAGSSSGSRSCCSTSTPPVPKPRKSVLHRRARKGVVIGSDKVEAAPAELLPPQPAKVLNPERPVIEPSLPPSAAPAPATLPSLLIPSEQTTILPNGQSNGHSHSQSHAAPLQPSSKKTKKSATKAQSFRQQLQRINRIASNKLLSIRLKPATTTGNGTADSSSSQPRRKRLSSQLFFGFSSSSDKKEQQPYRRPTRTPPPTPILIFRPAAPLPGEVPSKAGEEGVDPTLGEQTPSNNNNGCWWLTNAGQSSRHRRYLLLGQSSSSPSTLYDCDAGNGNGNGHNDDDDISELYHDAAFLEAEEEEEGEEGKKAPKGEDIESIYCSVDESNAREEEEKEIEEEEEDFYDDGEECIYEELSSIYEDGTIYEDYLQEQEEEEEEENVYDNADAELPPLPPPNTTAEKNDLGEEEGEMTSAERQMRKRLKKLEKAMRRFKLTGEEIPLSAGIVKRDQRGSGGSDLIKLSSRLDASSLRKALATSSAEAEKGGMLKVRAGETVLILRIEGNPPGLWLGKSERSKIGYVDCNNLYFDTESIKAVITGFHNTVEHH